MPKADTKKSKKKKGYQFNKPSTDPDELQAQTDIKEPPVTVHVNTKDDGSLKELIEKNIKWSQVLYEQNRKIKRRLGWMVFGSYLRLTLILAPIILAFIYLPPLLEQFWSQYSSLLGGGSPANILGNQGVGEILNQISNDQLKDLLGTFQQ